MENERKRVLLIGGTGLISSAVTRELVNRKYKVFLLNRGMKKRDMEEEVTCIYADIKKESVQELKKKIDGYTWDTIIDFVSYRKTELQRTLTLFSGLYEQFIFISTATVCDNQLGYIKEEDVNDCLKWKYSVDKREAELFLINFHYSSTSWYTIVRPYITYSAKRLPLQFSPLSYYTNINRIKNNKPLPVCNRMAHTSIISDAVFAIGCIGLILNPCAKNEVFNITNSRSAAWDDIYKSVYADLNTKPNVVEVTTEFLLSEKIRGFDKNEILYDKSLNRRFDTSKINSVVPEFKEVNESCSNYDFKNVIKYYSNNINQTVDYRWDARIDNMLAKWYKQNGVYIHGGSLSLHSYKNTLSCMDKMNYLLYRYNATYFMCRLLSRLKMKIYCVWKVRKK